MQIYKLFLILILPNMESYPHIITDLNYHRNPIILIQITEENNEICGILFGCLVVKLVLIHLMMSPVVNYHL